MNAPYSVDPPEVRQVPTGRDDKLLNLLSVLEPVGQPTPTGSGRFCPSSAPGQNLRGQDIGSLGYFATPTGIECATEERTKPEKKAASAVPANVGTSESASTQNVSNSSAPVGPSESESSDAEIEALYLAALRDDRTEDADELRAIRRARRHARAGVAELAEHRLRRR
jgi:hypothetical protein